MRSHLERGVLGLLMTIAAAVPAQAQNAWLGAGGSFPIGDFGDYADTGYLLVGGVGFPLGEQGLSIYGEAFFGQNDHGESPSSTQPYGVMGGVEFTPGDPGAETGVYFFGQLGLLVHRFSPDEGDAESDSGLGFGGGGGLFFPLGGVSGFVEGRILHASIDEESTSFLGALFGIAFPLGGGDGM